MRKLGSVKELFWSHIRKSNDLNECWQWINSRGMYSKEYGNFNALGETSAHRVSWAIHFGAIPQGIEICHKCDNPPCVNPNHLFKGTHKDNLQDAVKKGRMRLSDETKNKIRLANLGKKRSEEALHNMSLAQMGKKFSKEHRYKISLALRGKKYFKKNST